MPAVDLSEQEVQALLQVLMNSVGSPWSVTHPLIMKIGNQMQGPGRQQSPQLARGNSSHGDGDSDAQRRATETASGV